MNDCTAQQSLDKTIADARYGFEKILLFVTQPSNGPLHEIERGLFHQLLALGALLLQIFLTNAGTGDVGISHTNREGVVRKRYGTKNRVYQSVFGKLHISRLCYWKKGKGSVFPLDAQLNLPQNSYSYLLQEWGLALGVQGAWEKVTDTLRSMLKLDLWGSCLERIAEKAEQDVAGFYSHHSKHEYQDEAELLVVTVDGKGVPIKKDEPAKKKVRLTKGEKPGRKKMSTVTAVYTVNQHHREVDDIVKNSMTSHIPDTEPITPKPKRPEPRNKIVKATLKGKKAAFEDLVQQVECRDPKKKKKRVALVDGERKLRELLIQHLPDFCIILDLYHVLEYLWVASHVLHREGSEAATTWVECMLRLLLQGKIEEIIIYLKGCHQYHELSKSKKASLKKVIGYLERGKSFMRYDLYISLGYPIGSGVVEGACKNLVKDRMELSGMRWTIQGAEAMLRLRSIAVNGLSDAFWSFRIDAQREHLYGHILYENELERLAA
jgi:hypothetical protein